MPIRTPRAVRQSNSNIHQRIRSAIEALESRLLLSAGDPDPSFGSAGKVQLPGTAGETNYRINAVAVQSDGKTLLAGSAGTYDTGNQGQFFLERLSADGTPDAGFGTGGIVLTGFSNLAVANAIAVQADGKIVLGGMDETTLSGLYDGDAQFAMARFNADGTPDAGFGTSGKVLTRIPGREQVSSLSIAPDGKIVAAGLGTYQDPAHPSDANYASPIFAVARYTTSGVLDTSFNGTGYVYRQTDEYGPNEAGIPTIAVGTQPDGKVVVGGSFKEVPAVWRFNVDGSSDTSFGVGGMAWKPLQYIDLDNDYNSARISRLVIQPDGKVLVAGAYDSGGVNKGWMLARFNSNGTVDSGFGSTSQVDGSGIVLVKPQGTLNDRMPVAGLGLQTDGKIIVGGIHDTTGAFHVARYQPDGTPDPTYNTSDIGFDAGLPSAGTMFVMPDDRTVLAGVIPFNPFPIGVVRLQGDAPPATTPATPTSTTVNVSPGGLDPLFGSAGRIVVNDQGGVELPSTIQQRFNAVAVQTDGKVLVAGSAGTRDNAGKGSFLLERFNADGTPDAAFGTGGAIATAFGPISYATTILIQADGRIVLGGASEDSVASPTNVMFALARYTATGALDSTFGTGGKVTTDFTGNEQIDSLALTSDGKVVAVGSSFSFPNIGFDLARYNTDGTPDTSLNGAGTLAHDLGTPPANAYPSSVAIQPGGKILVGALSGASGAVFRYNADGTLDDSFANHGVATLSAGADAAKLALQSDGKILVGLVDPPGGVSVPVTNSTAFAIARLSADGTPDAGFGSAGIASVNADRTSRHDPNYTPPAYEPLGNLLVQSDGKIILAANQQYVDGFTTTALGSKTLVRRFLADGTPDSGFQNNTDPAFDPLPYAHGITLTGATLAPDGKLVTAADVWSNNSSNSPHWSGVARYITASATVTIPPPQTPGNGTGTGAGTGTGTGTGQTPPGTTPGGTPLPAGQLTASLLGSLPATITGTSKGTISVRITNSAKTRFNGPASISLYASADGALSGDDSLITTLNIPALNLAGGKSKTVKLKFTYPASIATGTYALLAAVTHTNDNTAPAIAASAKTMSIKTATVDIAAAFASGNSFTAKLSSKSKTTLILTNTGNVAATGAVQINLFASADQSLDASDTVLSRPITKKVNIKPNKSIRINLHFTVPSTTFNFLLAQIIPTTLPADASSANDVASASFTAKR